MSQFIAFIFSQLIEVTLNHLNNTGKLQNLTEEEAQAYIDKYRDALKTDLPSPGDLERA